MADHADPESPSRQRRLSVPAPLVERTRAALAHHRAGRPAEARGLYEAILAEAPRYPPALNGLGLVRLAQGEPERARALLAEAVALRPDSARYRYNLGNALDALRLSGAAAAACLRRVVALRPESAGALNDLGSLYMLRGLVREALDCFDRAIDLDPSLGAAYFNRGKLRAETTPDAAVRADLVAAMRLAPHLATEAACHLAVLSRHLCDWQDEAAQTAALCARIEHTLRDEADRGLPPLTLNVVAVPAPLRLAA